MKIDDDTEIRALDIDVPPWIDQDITVSDVAAIVKGGCASGAYMPAVTYYQALATMGEHGDRVIAYLDTVLGEIPTPPEVSSWSGLACFYLSCAVELWVGSLEIDPDVSAESTPDVL